MPPLAPLSGRNRCAPIQTNARIIHAAASAVKGMKRQTWPNFLPLRNYFRQQYARMKLDDAQKRLVAQWIEQGAKLSEIQTRIASEFKLTITYMDVRFLVDDLKLIPKDPEPVKTPDLSLSPAATPLATKPVPVHELEPVPTPQPSGTSVSVMVDQIARPGTLVSGKVTFSDGHSAEWSLDQTGRLALAAQQKDYRPAPADVKVFQQALQNELAKMGF